MEVPTLLIILAAGQLALLVLDVRERYLTWPDRSSAGRLRFRSAGFLVGTILLYSGVQFGGLALVPSASDVLASSQEFVARIVHAESGPTAPAAWKIVLLGTAAFYIGGLFDYLFHRFISHSRPMWFSHEYHHLPTDISVYMPGICARPFAVIAIFPVMVMSIFSLQLMLGLTGTRGFDVMSFLYLAIFLQLGIGSMSHSTYLRRCWWLHGLMKPFGLTTPQEHWFHHVAELDGNFGNFTTVWDRVLGTYLDPKKLDSRRYRAGLDYDQDFLGAVTLGKLKLSEQLRRHYQLQYFCYLESPEGPPPTDRPSVTGEFVGVVDEVAGSDQRSQQEHDYRS